MSGKAFCQFQGIQRMNPLKSSRAETRLVFLQMPDQMPFKSRKILKDIYFFHGFLYPVFPKNQLPALNASRTASAGLVLLMATSRISSKLRSLSPRLAGSIHLNVKVFLESAHTSFHKTFKKPAWAGNVQNGFCQRILAAEIPGRPE